MRGRRMTNLGHGRDESLPPCSAWNGAHKGADPAEVAGGTLPRFASEAFATAFCIEATERSAACS